MTRAKPVIIAIMLYRITINSEDSRKNTIVL
jgi:hypothetical protein